MNKTAMLRRLGNSEALDGALYNMHKRLNDNVLFKLMFCGFYNDHMKSATVTELEPNYTLYLLEISLLEQIHNLGLKFVGELAEILLNPNKRADEDRLLSFDLQTFYVDDLLRLAKHINNIEDVYKNWIEEVNLVKDEVK